VFYTGRVEFIRAAAANYGDPPTKFDPHVSPFKVTQGHWEPTRIDRLPMISYWWCIITISLSPHYTGKSRNREVCSNVEPPLIGNDTNQITIITVISMKCS